MGKVRLDRANRTELLLIGVFSEGLGSAFYFDRVAQFGTRTMAFEVTNGLRVNLRIFNRFFYRQSLHMRLRNGETIAYASIGQGRSLDNAPDVVAITLGICQGFQDHGTHAFAQNSAIGANPIASDDI